MRLESDAALDAAISANLFAGKIDAASGVIADNASNPALSAEALAIARNRTLAARGRLADALAALAPFMAAETPSLAAARWTYVTLARLLRFSESRQVAMRSALTWADPQDVDYAVHHLLYGFDYVACIQFLQQLELAHPHLAPAIKPHLHTLADRIATLEAALACHGPAETVPADSIYDALSAPGTAPERIVWAQRALLALCARGGMDGATYRLFAWFLPNWEQSEIRHRVLEAALRTDPAAANVARAWLTYLFASGAYGDAARAILKISTPDDNVVFYAISLLRLQADAIVPAFLDPPEWQRLHDYVRVCLPRLTSPAFRFVMQDHVAALNLPASDWTGLTFGGPFRRLAAARTGPVPRRPQHSIRPVVAISGALRGFRQAWPTQRQHFVAPTGAPVVLSVWDRTANALGRHAGRLERCLPPDIVDRLPPAERFTDSFAAAYPNTANLIFCPDIPVDEQDLRAQLGDAHIIAAETQPESIVDCMNLATNSGNMPRMFFKFARLETLIRAHEVATGQNFSHVIWLRPDAEILRMDQADLASCLARPDVAWSSFGDEANFGDYAMILPRLAFAEIASIFPRVAAAGDTLLQPWRPLRDTDPRWAQTLDAFGGPDTLFDTLLAAGYVPQARIPRIELVLRGYMPNETVLRAVFEQECATRSANRH
jgi:hypothetical protein